jgi:hypothetical protein
MTGIQCCRSSNSGVIVVLWWWEVRLIGLIAAGTILVVSIWLQCHRARVFLPLQRDRIWDYLAGNSTGVTAHLGVPVQK